MRKKCDRNRLPLFTLLVCPLGGAGMVTTSHCTQIGGRVFSMLLLPRINVADLQLYVHIIITVRCNPIGILGEK